MSRKPGVASNEDMRAFFVKHDPSTVVIVDARSSDFTVEPGDAITTAVAPLPSPAISVRPQGLHCPYDRSADTWDWTALRTAGLTLTTPIVTHCGGGGRGQKARLALEEMGFTTVINGGGPEVEELWAMFGHL